MNTVGKVVAILGAAGLLAWGTSSFVGEDSSDTYVPTNSFEETSSIEEDFFEPSALLKADTDYETPRPHSTGDRDCGDFSSHAQAQAFFKDEGPGDPHGLDRDGDGVACETLP